MSISPSQWAKISKKYWEDLGCDSSDFMDAFAYMCCSLPKTPISNTRSTDPVYNNTLNDFTRNIQPVRMQFIEKQCDCGAQKTYGKDCKKSFHSDWCSIK